jgi:hypothetical protein
MSRLRHRLQRDELVLLHLHTHRGSTRQLLPFTDRLSDA